MAGRVKISSLSQTSGRNFVKVEEFVLNDGSNDGSLGSTGSRSMVRETRPNRKCDLE